VLLVLKNLIFTLVVPGTVAVYVPWLIARGQPVGSLAHVLTSSVLVLLGGAIYLWCLWDFAFFGRGTPVPIDPPRRLVVRGPYRYTRNPMYLGVLTAILGWAVLFRSLPLVLYAFAVGVVFHLFVVFYEEPRLRRAFEADYEYYSARVGRWLPRVVSSGSTRANGR
jgi:protein-S-isoprenylcysteine O-methyltransferase Ste14